MKAGRKKKCRVIDFDTNRMVCHCFGPTALSKKELHLLPKEKLWTDELQALIYQDIDGLTMLAAAKKMGISKTVFATIYTSAKNKLINSIITPKILIIECEEKTI